MKNLKTLSKRGLALFMSLVLCLGMLPATAMAVEDGEDLHEHVGYDGEEILPGGEEDGSGLPEDILGADDGEPIVTDDVGPAEEEEPLEEDFLHAEMDGMFDSPMTYALFGDVAVYALEAGENVRGRGTETDPFVIPAAESTLSAGQTVSKVQDVLRDSLALTDGIIKGGVQLTWIPISNVTVCDFDTTYQVSNDYKKNFVGYTVYSNVYVKFVAFENFEPVPEIKEVSLMGPVTKEKVEEAVLAEFNEKRENKDIGTVSATAADNGNGTWTVTVSWPGEYEVKSGYTTYSVTVTDIRPTAVITVADSEVSVDAGDAPEKQWEKFTKAVTWTVTAAGDETVANPAVTVEYSTGEDVWTEVNSTTGLPTGTNTFRFTVADADGEYLGASETADITVKNNKADLAVTVGTPTVALTFDDNGNVVLDGLTDEAEAAAKAAVTVAGAPADMVLTAEVGKITAENAVDGGTVAVTVTWDGDDQYNGFEKSVAVSFADNREDGQIVLKAGPYTVRMNGYNGTFAEGSVESAVWAAAVQSTEPQLTTDSLTVTGTPAVGGTLSAAVKFAGNAQYKAAEQTFTVQVEDSRAEVAFNENSTAMLGYTDEGKEDYAVTAANISKAVFGDQITLGYDDMTFTSTSTYEFKTDTLKNRYQTKTVKLAGESTDIPLVGTVGYPAISEGPQRLQLTFAGDETYQGFTREVTVTMTGRLESSIIVNENAYVISVGKDADTDAIKQAIFDAVVQSTTPEGVTAADVTIQYNANTVIAGDKAPIWIDLEGGKVLIDYGPIPLQKEVQIKISWNGNAEYKGCEATHTVILDNREATKIVLNEGQSVVYEYYEDEYAALEQSVMNAVFNSEGSILPEGAELKLEYKARVELKAGETTLNISEVVDKINALLPDGSKIDADTILNGLDTAWVPFAGGDATITSEDLGALDDIINKLPVGKDWIREQIDKLLAGIDLSQVASYPPITAGEQEIRVSYAGNTEYCPSSATVKIIITKAPVSVKVNNTAIYADEALPRIYSATRTDNGRDVSADAYVVYAGVSANATVDLYLTIPDHARSSIEYGTAKAALKAIGLDLDQDTITLEDLYKGLGSTEKVAELLKKIFGSSDENGTLGKIIDAIQGAGDSGAAADIIASLKGGLDTAISFAGTSIRFHINGTPEHKAGAYGVLVFLDDVNYEAA